MQRVFIIAAVAGVATALAVPAAEASDHGWQPYRTQPFTTSGVCPFTVRGDIVRDEEEVRTVTSYPDGTPRIQEFRGPLVIRFTDTANGRSVVRDLSGHGRVRHRKDGGSVWHGDGGFSVRIFIGNRAYPAGWYILHGRFTLIIEPDNTRDLRTVHGEIEDLCQTLA